MKREEIKGAIHRCLTGSLGRDYLREHGGQTRPPRWVTLCVFLLVFVMIVFLQPIHGESAENIPIIDAHSQFDQFIGLDEIMDWLRKGRVSRVILSDRSTQMIDRREELLSFAAKYPDRITPAIRTKPPGYGTRMTGQAYARYLEKQAQNPAYGALAEIISTHAAMRNSFFALDNDVEILPSDPRICAAAVLAKKKSWPLLIHIEFRYIKNRKALFMEEFERLLAENADLPVGLMHLGQLEAAEAERLTKKYPNIFFMLSTANPAIVTRAERNDPNRGWVNMFEHGRLKSQWHSLILLFPSRFVLAFDNVFKPQWSDLYLQQIAIWRKALSDFPGPVAHAVAYANAERLWNLAPALSVE